MSRCGALEPLTPALSRKGRGGGKGAAGQPVCFGGGIAAQVLSRVS